MFTKALYNVLTFLFIYLSGNVLLYSQQSKVRYGADVFFEKYYEKISGKRVGVICNHTSLLSNGVHIVDSLLKKNIDIVALFSPEHGIRGRVPAGIKVQDQTDSITGIKIYSLYGKTLKPTPEMLQGIEVLLFDLQDVGARFYTYNVTMAYAMQAAAENKIRFILLDRPNPINGVDVEGPLLDVNLKSAVGFFPIPIRHGLTLGEIAKMAVGENWIDKNIQNDLTVIPMENWKRKMYFDGTKLPWVSPSPNMKTVSTAVVYPGNCLFEATNISEGRGTEKPFEYIGAPWIDGKLLAKKLNDLKLKGLRFEPIEFTPASDSVTGATPKYANRKCSGIYFKVLDRQKYKPVETFLYVIQIIQKFYPDSLKYNRNFFDKLIGDKKVLENLNIKNGRKAVEKFSKVGMEGFKKNAQKYLIYAKNP
ncbi:MAG: DUF1343 domain-containing protein [Bacteroidota bacterium]|nr:DUF1343 domain-containing protein [Bacteroidota bacterium]